jgi:hypothetical protein
MLPSILVVLAGALGAAAQAPGELPPVPEPPLAEPPLLEEAPRSSGSLAASAAAEAEPHRNTDGWSWSGGVSGFGVGGAVAGTLAALLLVDPPPGIELTNEEMIQNIALTLTGLGVWVGLTFAGLHGFPALAEAAELDGGAGYELALVETSAMLSGLLGGSIASIAGADVSGITIAATGAAVAGGVLAGIASALVDGDSYDDPRLAPLVGATSFALLGLLVGALVLGLAGVTDPVDDLGIIVASSGIAGSIALAALVAAR